MTPPLPPGGMAGIPVYFTQYETELNLTYDLDVWEKNRNSLRAALGQVYADKADAAYARLQLGIALAQVYYQLQIEYKRRDIAQKILKNRQNYFNTVEGRLKGNLSNESDLLLAKFQLSQAEKALLEREIAIATKENQLRYYLAREFQDQIEDIQIQQKTLPVIPLPVNLPLHLVARRPDISAQLWLIYSAGREIEVAKAGFYPDFNLTAFLGFQTLRLHQLFLGKSSNFNIDPAVSLPIFDGGRLKSNLKRAGVHYDRAIYRYNDLVLNAACEVLNGIALVQNAEKQLAQAAAMREYQEGLNNYADLRAAENISSNLQTLPSQANNLTSLDEEMVALGNILQSVLLLIKALGGGYGSC